MMHHILVVEDEAKIASFLQKGLAEEGYHVQAVHDGRAGLDLALAGTANGHAWDLIVLDVMLPELDGFDVCRQLRAHGRQVPIIFLTARDGVHDKVAGLDLGADDYLTKPFAFEEFLARCRSLLRKAQLRADTSLRIADLVLDTKVRRVERSGQVVDLSTKEFALLQFLMENAGKVLSRMEISEKVWDIHFDTTTNVIDVHINRLRKKIDHGFDQKLIQTVRGSGYTLGQD
jgi:two-component system copper resistance phosphate regulon response regulator CusR